MAALALYPPVPPSAADIELARESSRALGPHAQQDLRMQIEGCVEMVTLPASAVRMLVEFLVEMAAGNAVSLTSVYVELTTQQAAEILGVSRPFVVTQLEAGKLKFHKVGAHCRIHIKDVMAYKQRMAADRILALDELADQA